MANPRGNDSQLSLLTATARRRLVRQYGRSIGGLALGMVLLLAVLVGVGLALIPLEVVRGPTEDPGGTVLEMAFWLTCLSSAVVSFRVMEALYRTGDVRLLAPLPVRTHTLFLYRLSGRLLEAALVALGGMALFAPVAWRGDLGLYAACAWVWLSGMLLTVVLGMAVLVYAGVSHVRGDDGMGAGASGQASFTMAPGLALGVSVCFILVEKLVAEEFLRGGFNKGAQVGLAIAFGGSLVALIAAWRWFTRYHYAALAAFLQSDLFVVDVGYEYFKEGPLVATGWERSMRPALVPLVRRDRLQYRRRFTLARLLVWFTAVGLGVLLFARGPDSLPVGMLLGLPMLVLVIFANPWGRLYSEDLEAGAAATLPLDPALHHRAKTLVASRETVELTIPLALALIIGLGLGDPGWKLAALLGALAASLPLASSTLLLLVARRRPGAALAVGLAISVAAMAAASISALAILGLDLLLVGAVYAMPAPFDHIDHPDVARSNRADAPGDSG